MTRPTRVFVSYSWDDELHKAWVARLAADLRRDGIETRLDQWRVELGEPLGAVMEREIRDNDHVLIVCTPEYRRKSDAGTGGVGFEGGIMIAEVAERGNHRKYIPVLARGDWGEAAPSWLRGKRYADLSTPERYAAGYGELRGTLEGKAPDAPTVGAGLAGRVPSVVLLLARKAIRESKEDRWKAGDVEEKAAGSGWHGRKAMAAYTMAGVVFTGLTLLYVAGILRAPESGGEVGKPVDESRGEIAAEESKARARPPGTAFRDCAECSAMVVVPAGSFTMGAPVHEARSYGNEQPMHRVTIAEPFAVGVYEVTRGDFRRFVEESGYTPDGGCWVQDARYRRWRLSMEHGWRDVGFDQTDQHPASCVDWNDAQEYIVWLSKVSGEKYRLLTESEWEYMARGGTSGARYWEGGDGGGRFDQCRFANGADRSTGFGWQAECRDRYEYTAPVGSYEANAFGIHDVLGNVWEWVQDCWRDGYVSGPNDASAWEREGCGFRVLRGGSRYVGPAGLRSAHRFRYEPATRNQNTGFRVARSLAGTRADAPLSTVRCHSSALPKKDRLNIPPSSPARWGGGNACRALRAPVNAPGNPAPVLQATFRHYGDSGRRCHRCSLTSRAREAVSDARNFALALNVIVQD